MASRPQPTPIQPDPERGHSGPSQRGTQPTPLSPAENSLYRLETLERAARAQQQSRSAAEMPDELTALESVYRYSILSSRIKVLRHEMIQKVESAQSLIDVAMPEEVRRDLDQYTTALRNYAFFRREGKGLFESFQTQSILATMKALDNPVTAPAPPEPAIDDPLSIITRELRLALTQSTSGLSKYKKSKDQKMLWQRFSMALGGGLALIGPMLIMVRNPTGDVAIITTSCCVLGVAVILAFFMNDSQPKDVVACTAAYAAVLVVFVGAGGGSQTGEAQGNGASTS